MTIKKIAQATALALVGLAFAGAAIAEYPEKPIRMIIPYGQGGATDTIGRMVADPLSEALGVPVVVTNQPGAGGAVGVAAALGAPADGYTIAVGSDSSLSARPLMTDFRLHDRQHAGRCPRGRGTDDIHRRGIERD